MCMDTIIYNIESTFFYQILKTVEHNTVGKIIIICEIYIQLFHRLFELGPKFMYYDIIMPLYRL